LQIFFAQPTSEDRSVKLSTPFNTDGSGWKSFALNIKKLRESLKWGKKGQYMRFDFGSEAGKVIRIRELCVRKMTDKEKRLTAYHEAGHAVSAYYLEYNDPVHQVSIVPRGQMGGYTMYLPTEDKSYHSKNEMLDNLVSLLGGRVAEALIIGDVSTGASNDIERATDIARKMVTRPDNLRLGQRRGVPRQRLFASEELL